MEKNEKLTINNLLTWKDIIALGDPNGNCSTDLSILTLESCCKNNYDRQLFTESYKKYVTEPFQKQFNEDIDYKMLNIRLKYGKNADGTWRITFSKVDFFVALIAIYAPVLRRKPSDMEYLLEVEEDLKSAKNDEELKEKIVGYLRKNKKGYIDKIKEIREHNSPVIQKSMSKVTISSNELMIETLTEGRDRLNYYIKNIDSVIEYLNKDFPIEALNGVDKDRMLLVLSCMCSEGPKIRDMLKGNLDADIILSGLDNDFIISFFNYVNNYRLIVNYLEKENNCEYDISSKMQFEGSDDVIITSKGTTSWFLEFKDFVDEHEEIKEKLNLYESYEELLRDKASETWKKIENKRLVKNIMVNFEMIKSGPKIDLQSYNSGRKAPRITSNKEKRQAKLKHDYDVLDEKLEFYENNKGVAHGVGINNFTGYFAEFYPNGSVVLDKLFRYQVAKRGENKGKEVLVPAGDEAIYVMNYKEFADLSKYTKMELIQEIKDYDNKDVKRIYHSRNWKDNVLKEINGDGYGELDLGLLNMLTESISSNKEKSL